MVGEVWPAVGLALLSLLLAGTSGRLPFGENKLLAGASRLVYFIGLPYLALLMGLVTPRTIGLVGLEFFNLAAGVDPATAVMLMLLKWLEGGRMALLAGLAGLVVITGVSRHLARHGVVLVTAPPTVLDTIYDSLHWAFYRAIFWTITGDFYLGLVAGIAWTLLEWLLVTWGSTGRLTLAPLSFRAILLLTTSTIFYYSPNLWLLWPFHLAMASLAAQTRPRLKRLRRVEKVL